MKTFAFNPYTGKPRHPADIKSDPEGLLITEPGTPIPAYIKVPASLDDTELIQLIDLAGCNVGSMVTEELLKRFHAMVLRGYSSR